MIKNVNGEYATFTPDDQQTIYDWGVLDERERIVKLLENAQLTEAELYDGSIIQVKCESVRADLLIALIKGENK